MGDRCDLLCLDLERAERLRLALAPADELTRAATQAKALGDPTRLRLAAALAAGGELCVCDLAWIVGRPLKLVSHHLRALREADLARSRRDHRVVFYALTTAGRALVDAVTAVEREPVL